MSAHTINRVRWGTTLKKILLTHITAAGLAFVSGWFACTWMIRLVKRSNLAGFGAYCLATGILALIFG